jgi:uncharacterized protein (DUF1697 family)
MPTYISMLRGINVSGQKLMKMEVLKRLYEALGFENVITYLQSGNVVFESESRNSTLLKQLLSDKIKDDFGYEVAVFVMTIEQLCKIIERNPLVYGIGKEVSSMYITFLSPDPDMTGKKDIEVKKQEGEDIIFSNEAVYLYCPNGYGSTKLTNKLIESKLNVDATTRNWKTVNALLEIALQRTSKS